jgi:hypothetical protein
VILSRKFASGFEARYPQGLRSVRAKMIELVYSDSELISAINDRVAAERALRKINAYPAFVYDEDDKNFMSLLMPTRF